MRLGRGEGGGLGGGVDGRGGKVPSLGRGGGIWGRTFWVEVVLVVRDDWVGGWKMLERLMAR